MLDSAEDGLGLLVTFLELGCDRLGPIHDFHVVLADNRSQTRSVDDAICLQQEAAGLGRKHVDARSERAEARPRRRLVLPSIGTAAGQGCACHRWIDQHGDIESGMQATGSINAAACIPDEPSRYGVEVSRGRPGSAGASKVRPCARPTSRSRDRAGRRRHGRAEVSGARGAHAGDCCERAGGDAARARPERRAAGRRRRSPADGLGAGPVKSGVVSGWRQSWFRIEISSPLCTTGASVVGLVDVLLPFLPFPVRIGVGHVPRPLREAAFDHGATRWQAIREVEIPLAIAGFSSAR